MWTWILRTQRKANKAPTKILPHKRHISSAMNKRREWRKKAKIKVGNDIESTRRPFYSLYAWLLQTLPVVIGRWLVAGARHSPETQQRRAARSSAKYTEALVALVFFVTLIAFTLLAFLAYSPRHAYLFSPLFKTSCATSRVPHLALITQLHTSFLPGNPFNLFRARPISI